MKEDPSPSPSHQPISFSAKTCSSLTDFLEKAGELILEEILQFIPDRNPSEYLYDLMSDYPSRGGKRFRPSLVMLGCELFGGKIEDSIYTAIAYELFHNFALIHDDIEDESLMRRGKPALHQLHGTSLAVNVGDALHGLVYKALLANESILGPTKTLEVMRHFSRASSFTFEGQALDIGWVVHDTFPSADKYQEMIFRKTAWYSSKGPCESGAIIAGADKESITNIGRFGEAIGIGFQARDDVLNLITESENEAPSAGSGGYGKERGGDIAEGKRTLIIIEMLDRLKKKDAKRLHKILLKPRENNTDEEIEWCIEQAHECGALDAVIKFCKKQAIAAQKSLNSLPDHPARQLLHGLVDYLTIDRNA